jgi:hypothetical protein
VSTDRLASRTVTGMASVQQPITFRCPALSLPAVCVPLGQAFPDCCARCRMGGRGERFPALTAHHGNERTWTGMSTGAKAGP